MMFHRFRPRYLRINNPPSLLLLLILAVVSPMVSPAQTPITMGPQIGTYTGAVRGYYFVAPTNFTICQLYVEDEINTQMQHVEVVRLNAVPPTYPATTNAFTSLFYQNNWVPNTPIPCNIPISSGQIIGVFGARGNGTTMYNSYGPSPWTATVYGNNFDMFYAGMQFPLSNQQMHDIWYANFNRTGRVTMYYDCTVLDEQQIDFTAVAAGETALLNWSVVLVQDIVAYEIERSHEGADFAVIAELPSSGPMASEHQYIDRHPVAGTHFYRVRWFGLNGESSYSEIQSVTFANQPKYEIFPNPLESGGRFHVRTADASDAPLAVEVVDLQGRVVFAENMASQAHLNDFPINPGDLARGVYLVKVRQGDAVAVKRLMVR